MMKRVARSETLKLVETKRFSVINETATALLGTNQDQWSFRNVFGRLAGGSNSWQIVGQEIQRPLLKLKWQCQIDWPNISLIQPGNYGSIALNVYLIAANEQLPQTTFINYDSASGLDWFYQRDGFNPTMNGNNVKVLKHWRRVVTPDQVALGTIQGSQVVTGQMTYRWKRKLTYEDTGLVPTAGGPNRAGWLRGWNYYIVTGSSMRIDLPATAINIPFTVMDSFLYFKDP